MTATETALYRSMFAAMVGLLWIAAPARALDWYAEVFADNTDFIVVTVDATDLPTNVYLSDVSFEVTFLGKGAEQLGRQTFEFTDSELREVDKGRHRKYVQHSFSGVGRVAGEHLDYIRHVLGGKADELRTPPPPVRGAIPSTGKPLTGLQARVVGTAPAPRAAPPQFNFNGVYDMVHDGWRGTLLVNVPNATYTSLEGRNFNVIFQPQGYRVTFYVLDMGMTCPAFFGPVET